MRARLRLLSALFLLTPLALPAATDTRPPITGIAYVRFLESDMPAELPGGAESFAVGMRQHIEIAPLPSPVPPSRLAMVGFLTPDVHAMARYLHAHNIAVEPHGADEIRLHDPEGNAIELWQPPA